MAETINIIMGSGVIVLNLIPFILKKPIRSLVFGTRFHLLITGLLGNPSIT